MESFLAVLGALACALWLLTLYFCWRHEAAGAPRPHPAASAAADPAGAACPVS